MFTYFYLSPSLSVILLFFKYGFGVLILELFGFCRFTKCKCRGFEHFDLNSNVQFSLDVFEFMLYCVLLSRELIRKNIVKGQLKFITFFCYLMV